MLSYILKRLLLMLPTLLGVLTATFILIQFVPGGPVEQIPRRRRASARAAAQARGDLDAKQVEAIKKLYGFDKPPLERYVEMLEIFARFDFGTSFQSNRRLDADQGEAAGLDQPRPLVLPAAYLLSVPLGIAKAVREGSRFDALSSLRRAGRLRAAGLRPRRGADRAVLRRHVLELFPLRGLTSDNW